MFLLGESTLALSEEVLQALDAVEPAVNRRAPERPSSASTPFAPLHPLALVAQNENERDLVQVRDGASFHPSDKGSHRHPCSLDGVCEPRGDSKRARWRADCKELAQKLLFSEDSEEVEHPQSTTSKLASACVNVVACQNTQNSQKAGRSSMCVLTFLAFVLFL